MTTVYLHIGVHKTGTTAIQRVLTECRQRLLDADVLVPETGRAMGSTHQLAWVLSPDCPEWYPLSPDSPEQLFARLRDECERSGKSKIILSSEDFSLLDMAAASQGSLDMLKRLLAPWQVKVILYLRPQADYLTAFYNQVHKANDTRFADRSVDGIRQALDGVLHYDQLVQRWQNSFGADNVVVRAFNERKQAGDIAEDFLAQCGIDIGELPVFRSNESLSPEVLAFRRMINAFPGADASKAALEQSLVAISEKGPSPIFSQRQADAIMALYATANQWLIQHCDDITESINQPLSIASQDTDQADSGNIDNYKGDWKQATGMLSALVGEVARQSERRQNELQSAFDKEISGMYQRLGEADDRVGKLEQRVSEQFEQINQQNRNAALSVYRHAVRQSSIASKLTARHRRDAALVRKYGCLDPEYYLAEYPDVAESEVDPVMHYIQHGALEGRNPSAGFDTADYLYNNMDAAIAGMNPLVHFIRLGPGACLPPRVRQDAGSGSVGLEIAAYRAQSPAGKHIVVIDHDIPQYDKTAGARHTFHYLKLLVELGYAVTFLPFVHTEDDTERHVREMTRLGINILEHTDYFDGNWSPDGWKHWLDSHRDDIDLVFINRPHIARMYMDYSREELQVPVWYMCHDLHFLRLRRQAWIEKNLRLVAVYLKFRIKEKAIFKKADISFTPSVIEEEYVRKHFGVDSVVTLPLYVYDDIDASPRVMPESRKITFVGSFEHDPNADAVKWFISEVLPLVVKECPDVEFNIVGANPPASISKLSGDNVRVHGFVTDDELDELYAQTRAILIPLRYGAGVKGKVVEALKSGTPFVSTRCGIEGIASLKGLVEGHDSAAGFAAEVCRVINMDAQQDSELSVRLKAVASKNFSTQTARQLVQDCLNKTVENNSIA